MRRLTSLFLLLMFISCDVLTDSDTISESEAKKLIAQKFVKDNGDLAEIIEFKKTDGVKQEFMGMKAYLMKFTVKVKFNKNVRVGIFTPLNFYPDSKENRNAGPKTYEKGDMVTIADENSFERTENGWNY